MKNKKKIKEGKRINQPSLVLCCCWTLVSKIQSSLFKDMVANQSWIFGFIFGSETQDLVSFCRKASSGSGTDRVSRIVIELETLDFAIFNWWRVYRSIFVICFVRAWLRGRKFSGFCFLLFGMLMRYEIRLWYRFQYCFPVSINFLFLLPAITHAYNQSLVWSREWPPRHVEEILCTLHNYRPMRHYLTRQNFDCCRRTIKKLYFRFVFPQKGVVWWRKKLFNNKII